MISFAFCALREADISTAVVVVSPEKQALMRSQLGTGKSFGVDIHYVLQDRPLGLPNAVRAARAELDNRNVALVMPDTIFMPTNALARIRDRGYTEQADIVLGVFPTEYPEALAPVEFDQEGRVMSVHDKPEVTAIKNTWGVMWWTAAFSDLCRGWKPSPNSAQEPTLSAVTNQAIAMKGKVIAEAFDDGMYCDAGTRPGFLRAQAVAARELRPWLLADRH